MASLSSTTTPPTLKHVVSSTMWGSNPALHLPPMLQALRLAG